MWHIFVIRQALKVNVCSKPPTVLNPSPVRNLTVVQNVDLNTGRMTASITWRPPSMPEGEIVRYEIVVSTENISTVYSGNLHVCVCVCVFACV